MYDVLLKNGTIVDGTGQPPFQGDLAMENGRIAAVGKLSEHEAAQVIDVSGKCIAPGFIDSHSHSDWVVFMGYQGKSVLEQGVTTEICGNCGSSVAPLMPYEFDTMVKIPDATRKELEAAGGSIRAVFQALEDLPKATNMALFIGQGVIRGKVMDYDNRTPTREEMEQMKAILREGMEQGALGLSSGLIYPPGSYTPMEELAELCTAAGEYGGSYATHMRSEGERLLESMEETLEVAKRAGVSIVFSHHKVDTRQHEGKSVQSLALIEKIMASGRKVLVDTYPYTGAAATLSMVIPHHFVSDGKEALRQKLMDPETRLQIADLLRKPGTDFPNILYNCTPEGVLVSGTNPGYDGKTLTQIAAMRRQDVYETLFDLLLDYPDAQAIFLSNSLWDMENILKKPYVAFGMDGVLNDHKSPNDHPRVNATFPRLLGEYCRDRKFFTLEECVHRMTGLVADFYGFENKGKLAVGCDADVVVFDPHTVDGPADYGQGDRPNEGIEYVFVNGQLAVKEGQCTGIKAGKLLRKPVAKRKEAMP